MSSTKWKVVIGSAVTAVALAASHPAYACGAAYPGGPVMCDYPRRNADGTVVDSPADSKDPTDGPPIVRIAGSYAFTSTTIKWGEGRRSDLTRHTAFADLQMPLNTSGSLTALAGVGVIAGGTLVHGAARDTIQPGIAADLGIAGRVYNGNRYLPFVQLTLTISFSHTGTETDAVGTRTNGTVSPTGQSSPAFNAGDLRGGVIIGKTFGSVFTPYVTGRAFGGPISWRFDDEHVTGTDAYHYQVGGGLALSFLKRRLDVFAEGIAFGERGIAAGIGTTFF